MRELAKLHQRAACILKDMDLSHDMIELQKKRIKQRPEVSKESQKSLDRHLQKKDVLLKQYQELSKQISINNLFKND